MTSALPRAALLRNDGNPPSECGFGQHRERWRVVGEFCVPIFPTRSGMAPKTLFRPGA